MSLQMKKLPLVISLMLFMSGCGGIGKNYQDVREREMKTDPCKYERIKGGKAEVICKARVAAGRNGSKEGGGLFDNVLEELRGEIGTGNGQNIAVNKWLWNGSIETVKDFPLKIADAFGGVIETDWINNANMPDQRCAIKILIKTKDFISNGVSANMICQSFNGSSWTLNNNDLSEANREIENSILSLARKSFLNFSG
jgi:hypothetical protein|tara:strand:+ start:255 stop:848 length:594 start_codon:yes stop_codon:yes gene_type:complete